MAPWDYIIIGAGSAGCVLANRLSADPKTRVLLLEAGGSDLSPYIHIPAAIIKAVGNPRFDWCHLAEPDDSRLGKVDLWPAGKTLGGSSSINGMLFVRGAKEDFDLWAEQGNPGWSFKDVLPYFKRMESYQGGEDSLRGRDGPMSVSPLRSLHPLASVFVEAATESGLPFNEDYNGAAQEGIAYPQVTQKRGRRWSAAQAFLRPIGNRKNLKVLTKAQCTRLIFKDRRCAGVEYSHRGRLQTAEAAGEILLSAGAIGSPKILMTSGVGRGEDLKPIGIDVVSDSLGVGQNLQDHPEGMVSIDVNVSTYNTEISSPRMAWHLLNWMLFRRGPATSPYPHSVGFFRSTPSEPRPDIQVMLGPYAFSFSEEGILPYEKPAVSAALNPSFPESRGQIRLASGDWKDPPVIKHDLLGSDKDIAKLTAASRKIRDIFNMSPFDPYRVGERLPGPDVQSDDEWADYFRRTAFLGYHPVGTCKMGPGVDGVVDHNLKVKGVEGLRVIDASIIPQLISGNTNGAALMIAERASDLILEHRSI